MRIRNTSLQCFEAVNAALRLRLKRNQSAFTMPMNCGWILKKILRKFCFRHFTLVLLYGFVFLSCFIFLAIFELLTF